MIFKREPALILGLVSAAITLATSFGVELTQAQQGAISAFVAALVGVVVRQLVTPNVSKREE